ncbi:Transcriptional adapter ADA2b [Sesamum alatum]|uniref:Transcriptional adapter ADA2b n=1 Tax=Sesamum alatum TaxID=300844 RepID=A0AAE1YRD2_9LAMI|nr:Transcriptional adapter ADA2b [Sesamum alatum]
MFGIGSWADVAEHVGTKTQEACIEHYTNAYLNSPYFPLPGKFRRNLQLPPQESGRIKVFLVNAFTQAMLEHLFNFCMMGFRIEDSRQSGASRRLPSTPTPGGYNLKRHELDIEYDNDVEKLLVDMEFKETDDEWERELKLRIIRIYSKRVDERNRRKDFIIKRGLLHPSPFERDLSEEEKRLCRHYDIFMRLHSKEEHEELLKSVISVHRTQKRLQELKEARAAGCRSGAEADRYIKQKKKRLSEFGDHRTDISQEGPSSPESLSASVSSDSFDTYSTLTSAGQATSSTDLYSVTTSAANLLCESVRSTRWWFWFVSRYKFSSRFHLYNSFVSKEKQLCHEMGLAPNLYLKIQQDMTIEIMRGNITKKSDAYSMFQVEPTKIDKVYNVLVKKGIAPP